MLVITGLYNVSFLSNTNRKEVLKSLSQDCRMSVYNSPLLSVASTSVVAVNHDRLGESTSISQEIKNPCFKLLIILSIMMKSCDVQLYLPKMRSSSLPSVYI